jgi:hypothetical protein
MPLHFHQADAFPFDLSKDYAVLGGARTKVIVSPPTAGVTAAHRLDNVA